ncbi:MAG: hypothetical protein WCA08_20475 [Desulfoferrobacter sp.]
MTLLMIARSAGPISIIMSLILSFAGTGDQHGRLRLLVWLLGGVALLWVIANSKFVDRLLSHVIKWALRKWTKIDTRDYVSLLHLSGEYTVRELRVQDGDWLSGKNLRECQLNLEGITVLGIYRH